MKSKLGEFMKQIQGLQEEKGQFVDRLKKVEEEG